MGVGREWGDIGGDSSGVREEWMCRTETEELVECWGEILGWISNKWLYTYTIDLHPQIYMVHDAPCSPKCMLDGTFSYSILFRFEQCVVKEEEEMD